MTRENLLSVLDIAQELNTGKATLKFLLKRFKKWLPYDFIDGQPFYPIAILQTLITIQENLDMGVLPSEIENRLDAMFSPQPGDLLNGSKSLSQNTDIRLSNDGVSLLKSLFHEIGSQQTRIAVAHEKRAAAEEKRALVEERKAVAIEKRAAAEEKKADAMNNIANALQEMNRLRSNDPVSQQIVHKTVNLIATDEMDDTEIPPQPADAIDGMDTDVSSYLGEDNLLEEFSVVEALSESDDPALDDLSALLSEGYEETRDHLDDLSLLIDKPVSQRDEQEPLDDLSLLVDPDPSAEALHTSSIKTDPAEPVDDLYALIDEKDTDLDDLSKLIDDMPEATQLHPDLDDLSLLIEETVEPKSIKIDLSPEEDREKYKAAVMKVILELKTDGLSVEETTHCLNQNKVRTLSGKPDWSQKAISQVYQFITAAK